MKLIVNPPSPTPWPNWQAPVGTEKRILPGGAGPLAGWLIAESQGYNKEADAMQRVGKVVANKGGGKKTKKVKNTIGDISQIAALLGQTSGYMTPQQAALTQGIGSLIQGSGPQDLTGDVFHPPQAALPPRPRGARPKIAVEGGAHTKKKARFAVA